MNIFEVIDSVDNFSRSEFPDTVEHCDPDLILKLQDFRERHGRPIHPSRHPKGWGRTKPKYQASQHYADPDEYILGRAMDVFPEGNVLQALTLALELDFGGIGIYFDTRISDLQPGPMLHLDLRPQRVLWCRVNGKYYYPAKDKLQEIKYWSSLADYAMNSEWSE